MDWDLILVSGILISGAGMAVTPLFKDVLKDRTQNISVTNISWSGWLVLLFLATGVVLGIFKEKADRDENKTSEDKISNQAKIRHTQDSTQLENTAIRDSVALGKARDSIIYFEKQGIGSVKSEVDSIKKSAQRHLDKRTQFRLIKRLNDTLRNLALPKSVKITIGYSMGNEEAMNFALEVASFLSTKGYNINKNVINKTVGPTVGNEGKGFSFLYNAGYLLIDVGVASHNGYP